MTAAKTIEIELRREGDTGRSAYGALYLDGALRCYTLEDSVGDGYGKGRGIPPGRYRVTWEPSNRLKRNTLRLNGVPGREGILIHSGNTSADCAGCVLLGRKRVSNDMVGESRIAVSALENHLVPKMQNGVAVWITVSQTPKTTI